MLEDKLDQRQRIRLEALAQSIATSQLSVDGTNTRKILERAASYETFILGDSLMTVTDATSP